MKDSVKNLVKTSTGLLVGILLLETLKLINPIIIFNSLLLSIIQTFFFAFYYTILDKSIRKITEMVKKSA